MSKGLIAVLFIISAQSFAASYWDGVKQLKAGNKDQAYEIFTEIHPQQDQFFKALTELQKLHYKDERWEKFFAYALYYRQNFFTKAQFSSAYQYPMVALEVMALAKHCQWDQARKVGINVLRALKHFKLPTEKMESLMGKVDVMEEYSAVGKVKVGDAKPLKIQDGKISWPLKDQAKVTNPKKLHVRIQNRCSS